MIYHSITAFILTLYCLMYGTLTKTLVNSEIYLTLIRTEYFQPVFQLIPHGKRSYMTFEAPPPSPLPHNGGIVII